MKLPATGLALVLLPSLACGPGIDGGEPPTIRRESGSASAAKSPSSVEDSDPDTAERWTMPEPDRSYNVRQGKALFGHYCAICHGGEGHGDGFNAYNLDPRPRNLADPEFQAQQSDEDLAAVIRSGGGVSGLSTAMPPWGRSLNERDIQNIVDYLRALPQSTE